MVVLKRLAEAEADGDRIWAVSPRGGGQPERGRVQGPTVPNGPAQERVIEAALSQARRVLRRRWTTWRRTAPGPRWAIPSK